MRKQLAVGLLTAGVVWGGLMLPASGHPRPPQVCAAGNGHHCPTTTTTAPTTTTTTQPPTTTTTEPDCTGNPLVDPSGCPIDDCALPPGNRPVDCDPPDDHPIDDTDTSSTSIVRPAVPVVAQPHTTG